MKMREAEKRHSGQMITHSNGVKECSQCHLLLVPSHLMKVYDGPGYIGRLVEIEEEVIENDTN